MTFFILENQRTGLTSMINMKRLNYSINEHMKRIKEHLEGEKMRNIMLVDVHRKFFVCFFSYILGILGKIDAI
jgi:hypothetical protein